LGWVSSADLVLIVHSRPEKPTSTRIAFARQCQVDQNGRPISGEVGIKAHNSSYTFTDATAGIYTMVHEIYHAMGFNSLTWQQNKMLDEDLNPRGNLYLEEFPYPAYKSPDKNDPKKAPAGKVYSLQYIKSPRVLVSARRFFNCSSLEKLPFEDEGGHGSAGMHWEKMFMLEANIAASAVLNASRKPSEVLVEHSLAFFEDTGWYRTNLHKGGLSPFGFSAGCNFMNSRDCGPNGWGKAGSGVPSALSPGRKHWPTYDDTTWQKPSATGLDFLCSWDYKSIHAPTRSSTSKRVRPSWVHRPNSDRCNGSATSAAQFNSDCAVPPWRVHYPAGKYTFLSYKDAFWGADVFMNACPIIRGNVPCITGSETPSSTTIRGSQKGQDSRCFVGNLQRNDARNYIWKPEDQRFHYPYKNAACYQHRCTATTLHILVRDTGRSSLTVACPVDGGDVSVPGFKGKLTCPPFAELCAVEAKFEAAKAKLLSATALRFKGLIPLRGRAGTVVTVTARGLDDTASLYVGGKATDTCAGANVCLAVNLHGDARENRASCTTAGAACKFLPGLRVNSVDKSLGSFIVPPLPDGPVHVTLKAAVAQVDTGFSAFIVDSGAPISLVDDAKTRKLSSTALSGSSNELTNGPTHHMAYYWLPRDAAPFKPGTDDDLFYAVHLYYPADNRIEESATYSIRTVSSQTCRTIAADAAEKVKYDCSQTPLATCGGSCVVATLESVELTVDSSKHPPNAPRSSFQLLVNGGDVPSRRRHLQIIPSVAQVVQAGSLTHPYVDCRGQVVDIQAV
jgi:hypothetical protein